MSKSSSPDNASEARNRLMDIINGAAISQCVYVAAKLGIADLLKDGPKSSEELAATLQTHSHSLYRILRSLTGLRIFVEDDKKQFSLTPRAELLRSDVADSVRDWAIMRGEDFLWRPWGQILHSVETGEPAFDHVFGMDTWEYFSKNPEAATIFDNAMRSGSAQKFVAVAKTYDFSNMNLIVDVGGGNGGLMTAILRSNPRLKGIVADLSHVVENAQTNIEAEGLLERCSCIAIDMFKEVPIGADAYIMANVIQDCDDEEAIKVLSNCRQAMESSGRVLVVEMLIPAPNEPHLSRFSDIEMLVMTNGGRERSESEYRALYKEAGLQVTRIIPTETPWSIVEGAIT